LDPLGLLIGGLIAAMLGAYAGIAYLWNRWRDARMMRTAQTMGFRFEPPSPESAFLDLAGSLPILRKGRNRKVRRLLRGRLAGRDTAIFDFRYTTSQGGLKGPATTAQTVVIFLDAAGVPEFTLEPETVLQRLIDRVVTGRGDINFPEHDTFSKHYQLRGRDEAAIRRTFTGDVVTLLAGMTGWSVQSKDGRLAIFRLGRLTTPKHIPKHAADALRIARALRRSDSIKAWHGMPQG